MFTLLTLFLSAAALLVRESESVLAKDYHTSIKEAVEEAMKPRKELPLIISRM